MNTYTWFVWHDSPFRCYENEIISCALLLQILTPQREILLEKHPHPIRAPRFGPICGIPNNSNNANRMS